MSKAQFGNLIRQYRSAKGWTQADLARHLGYDSSQFISLLERNQSKVPVRVLGQLIVLLGVPEVEIVESLMASYHLELSQELSQGKKMAKESATKKAPAL